jgi:hypothetical protein
MFVLIMLQYYFLCMLKSAEHFRRIKDFLKKKRKRGYIYNLYIICSESLCEFKVGEDQYRPSFRVAHES